MVKIIENQTNLSISEVRILSYSNYTRISLEMITMYRYLLFVGESLPHFSATNLKFDKNLLPSLLPTVYAKTSFLHTRQDRYYPEKAYIFTIAKTVISQIIIYYFITSNFEKPLLYSIMNISI